MRFTATEAVLHLQTRNIKYLSNVYRFSGAEQQSTLLVIDEENGDKTLNRKLEWENDFSYCLRYRYRNLQIQDHIYSLQVLSDP